MRSATASIEVTRGNVQSENTFTIKATSKAFDILSSGLYSDKVKAIVRELSCNAHDSHVAAGKADTPIEVKLPTHLDPTFYVKDYGLGLSHEDVTRLYTTYFESTKANSDDYIGQLGLGSKSPFSYASTFTVESRFNGLRQVYTCFKNEQGLPAISKMGEEKTNEHNGVTVSLAVKREDVDKFNEAARKVFMYFNPTPVIKGNSGWAPYRIKHTIAGTNWKIRETDYYARMEKSYVVQGFVAYPVDTNILAEHGLSYAAKKLATTNLDLYVDIGQVEVAASREALSYDTRTIQNLIGVLEAAAKEMRASFQKEFDACKTHWEVAQMVGKFRDSGSYEFREIYNTMHTTDPFLWQGAPVSQTVELDFTSILTTTIRRMSNSGRKASSDGIWTPESSKQKMAYDISHRNLHILVDTEAKGHSQLADHFFNSMPDIDGGRPAVLIIAPTSKKLYNQKEVDLIVKQLGAPKVVKSSDLAYTRVKTGGYKKRTVEEKLMWKGFPEYSDHRGNKQTRTTFSRLCWSPETVVLEDGGVYVDIERFTPIKNGVHYNSLDDMISAAKKLELVADDFKLYGMTERDRKHIADNEDWVEFNDYIKERFDVLNANDALFKRCIYNNTVQQIGYNVRQLFVDNWVFQRACLKAGQFVDFFDKLTKLGEDAAVAKTEHVMIAVQLFYPTVNLNIQTAHLYNEWLNVINQYGMLSMINWSIVEETNVGQIIDYVNTMEDMKP